MMVLRDWNNKIYFNSYTEELGLNTWDLLMVIRHLHYRLLKRARNTKGPVLIHICTQKGKGYSLLKNWMNIMDAPRNQTGEVKTI